MNTTDMQNLQICLGDNELLKHAADSDVIAIIGDTVIKRTHIRLRCSNSMIFNKK